MKFWNRKPKRWNGKWRVVECTRGDGSVEFHLQESTGFLQSWTYRGFATQAKAEAAIEKHWLESVVSRRMVAK
jgi:hypothetical protein